MTKPLSEQVKDRIAQLREDQGWNTPIANLARIDELEQVLSWINETAKELKAKSNEMHEESLKAPNTIIQAIWANTRVAYDDALALLIKKEEQ